MYYILRHGTDDEISDIEFKTETTARLAHEVYFNSYQKQLENGTIKRFTCLILTRGILNNEETKGC